MKVLVTGGAGFIGSALCRHIVASAGSVVNVDKLTYAANLSAVASIADSPNYTFYKQDICDRAGLDNIFEREQPDSVIHLAAESHVDRSISGPGQFVTTNVLGTFQLLESAKLYWEKLSLARKDDFSFLHVSTDEVFGSLGDHGTFTENTRYDPSSPYSASKAASDHLATAWHRTYGMPTMIANCGNNYGPHQFPEKLIPLMITNALLGRTLPVYGQGANVRDWIYVDDHAQALFAIVRRGAPGSRYNIGARSERSNLSVVQVICSYLDERLPRSDASYHEQIEFVPDRPGHDFRYAISPDKLEQELGWRAKESFESGIAKTVDWYLANEAWWRSVRAQRYDGERLGLDIDSSTKPAIASAANS